MARDGDVIVVNPGILTFAGTLGFTAGGVEFQDDETYFPIQPEELGAQPWDYIIGGGECICLCSSIQWDEATRQAMGMHYVNGSMIERNTDVIGRRLREFAQPLTFTPDHSGQPGRTAPLACAVRGKTSTRRSFRTKQVTAYGIAFILLPDGNGLIYTEG